MAVMTARKVATRLVGIQKLSSLYHQAVEELRVEAVKTTVDTLWRRYKAHQKHEEAQTFPQWLFAKQHLETTFKHRRTGASLPTRRRWAIQYYSFLTRKELTLADDKDNLWIFDALERAINDKHDDPNWVVVVEAVVRPEMRQHRLKPGVSLMFGLVERQVFITQPTLFD